MAGDRPRERSRHRSCEPLIGPSAQSFGQGYERISEGSAMSAVKRLLLVVAVLGALAVPGSAAPPTSEPLPSRGTAQPKDKSVKTVAVLLFEGVELMDFQFDNAPTVDSRPLRDLLALFEHACRSRGQSWACPPTTTSKRPRSRMSALETPTGTLNQPGFKCLTDNGLIR
jgi:hypothetical protein